MPRKCEIILDGRFDRDDVLTRLSHMDAHIDERCRLVIATRCDSLEVVLAEIREALGVTSVRLAYLD